MFKLVLVHLAMGHAEARLGQELAKIACHGMNGANPVMDEKCLAATLKLPHDGVADDHLVEMRYGGADGQPVFGRRFDD